MIPVKHGRYVDHHDGNDAKKSKTVYNMTNDENEFVAKIVAFRAKFSARAELIDKAFITEDDTTLAAIAEMSNYVRFIEDIAGHMGISADRLLKTYLNYLELQVDVEEDEEDDEDAMGLDPATQSPSTLRDMLGNEFVEDEGEDEPAADDEDNGDEVPDVPNDGEDDE